MSLCCPTNPNPNICKYPNPDICKNPNPDISKYPTIGKGNIFIWRAALSPEITDSASQLERYYVITSTLKYFHFTKREDSQRCQVVPWILLKLLPGLDCYAESAPNIVLSSGSILNSVFLWIKNSFLNKYFFSKTPSHNGWATVAWEPADVVPEITTPPRPHQFLVLFSAFVCGSQSFCKF